MKIDLPDTYVENQGGAVEISKFGILQRDTAHILGILRKTIYSNPIRAVIREYSCNAVDAHSDLNLELPIEVVLPTYNVHTFSVRDFGPGLSPEDVKEIFCNYGASTKRGDNTKIGCLGLGSKSAFAINDNFVVTSWNQGVKTIYNCVLDASGLGSVVALASGPSSEPSGIKITVPVKYNDIWLFESEAVNVFKYFKIKPTLNKILNLDINVWKEGDGWKATNDKTSVILMGGVAYPIASSQFEDYSFLLTCGLIIEAELGSVDFAASREELLYSEKTKSFINEKLVKIELELKQLFKLQVAECKDLIEIAAFVSSLDRRSKTLARRLLSDCAWNNFPIANKQKVPIYSEFYLNGINDKGKREIFTQEFELTLETAPIFIVETCTTKVNYKRLKHFKKSNLNHVFCIDASILDKFRKDFPLPDSCFILAENVPSAPAESKRYFSRNSVYNPKYSKKIFVLNNNYPRSSNDWKIPDEEDLKINKKVYIRIDKYVPSNFNICLLRDVLSIIRRFYNVNFKLFGVKEAVVDVPDGFINLSDYLKSLPENVELQNAAALAKEKQAVSFKNLYILSKWVSEEMNIPLDKKEQFTAFAQIYSNIVFSEGDVSDLMLLFNIDIPARTFASDLLEKFPWLDVLEVKNQQLCLDICHKMMT